MDDDEKPATANPGEQIVAKRQESNSSKVEYQPSAEQPAWFQLYLKDQEIGRLAKPQAKTGAMAWFARLFAADGLKLMAAVISAATAMTVATITYLSAEQERSNQTLVSMLQTINDAKNAVLVLEFIAAVAGDDKVRTWAAEAAQKAAEDLGRSAQETNAAKLLRQKVEDLKKQVQDSVQKAKDTKNEAERKALLKEVSQLQKAQKAASARVFSLESRSKTRLQRGQAVAADEFASLQKKSIGIYYAPRDSASKARAERLTASLSALGLGAIVHDIEAADEQYSMAVAPKEDELRHEVFEDPEAVALLEALARTGSGAFKLRHVNPKKSTPGFISLWLRSSEPGSLAAAGGRGRGREVAQMDAPGEEQKAITLGRYERVFKVKTWRAYEPELFSKNDYRFNLELITRKDETKTKRGGLEDAFIKDVWARVESVRWYLPLNWFKDSPFQSTGEVDEKTKETRFQHSWKGWSCLARVPVEIVFKADDNPDTPESLKLAVRMCDVLQGRLDP